MASILVLNWRDRSNPAHGGAEVYTHEIFSRLAKNFGHKVTLVTSRFDLSKDEERIDSIKVIRIGNRYSVYGESRKYCEQNKDSFDVVVDEINTRPFLTPNYVKDRPIICLIHQLAREYWWYETPFPVSLFGYFFLEKYWLKKYRNVTTVTVSNSTAKDLVQLGFNNVSVIQNGVPIKPLDILPTKSDIFTCVFLARFKKVKRPIDAINAFSLIPNYHKARLIMIGDGPLRKSLQKRYQTQKNIIFLGNVSNEEKIRILTESHVHIAPYLREGWGNSVIEAAAVGTPTIGYNTSGLVDSIIDNKTGLLVPRFDTKALAAKIEYLLSDKSRIQELAQGCLEWAKKFSWDKSAAEFNALVIKVLGKRQHGKK